MTRRIDKPDTDADIELRGYLDADIRDNFVMVAGAGSGKTTSLVKALDHIGKTYGANLRRRNQQVACITYTELAVKEIWSDVGNNPLFHVSTIHSFLWTLAKPFQKDIAKWVRRRLEDKLMELNQARENFGPRVQQKTRDKNERDITRLKRQLETIDDVKRFKYEGGSDYLNGVLGHDDIIKMVPQLIKDRPLLAAVVAQKYPFIFVDESQDTFPEFVEALRAVAKQMEGKFCLGFFGDPMQQIYMTGVGEILLDEGWKKINKPENFRCPTTVLSVINNIRSQGDGLVQTRGRQLENGQAVKGAAKLFVLPADECRPQNLDRVRRWLAESCSDPHWASDSREADVRILVIVHRIAATRLGFPDLFAAFNDGAPESLSTGFREGTLWALNPFLNVLLPLTSALNQNRQVEVMKLLRTHCPRLDTECLRGLYNSSELLNSLKSNVLELATLMSPSGNASVLEVLQFADRVQLIKLDERLKECIDPSHIEPSENRPRPSAAEREEEKKEEEDKAALAIAAYLACPAKQLRAYYTYINDQSPYSTQQGIKGAEFERVIVVLDDEEGRHFQFSYDKLLGLKEPSKTDIDNLNQNRETVFDRTRRLFYVCCSRATKGLAVVLYSDDIARATAKLKASAMFQPEEIYTLDHISGV
jgi:DNA helicase II / ATP-dependent DNA helicase PcrA